MLHVKRFGVENIDNSILLDNRISISMQGGQLRTEAPDNIQSVEIFDMSGRKMDMQGNVRSNYLNKSLSLPKGIYIVRILLTTGAVKTEKMYVD